MIGKIEFQSGHETVQVILDDHCQWQCPSDSAWKQWMDTNYPMQPIVCQQSELDPPQSGKSNSKEFCCDEHASEAARFMLYRASSRLGGQVIIESPDQAKRPVIQTRQLLTSA